MENKEARESSIFYMLGLAYEWSTRDFSKLYEVSQFRFENWLNEMGFSAKEIENLHNRKRFGKGYCRHCGKICQPHFCSYECNLQFIDFQNLVRNIMKLKLIPLTNYRNSYYDVRKRKVVRSYEYR